MFITALQELEVLKDSHQKEIMQVHVQCASDTAKQVNVLMMEEIKLNCN